jgi:hypothetical protein
MGAKQANKVHTSVVMASVAAPWSSPRAILLRYMYSPDTRTTSEAGQGSSMVNAKRQRRE